MSVFSDTTGGSQSVQLELKLVDQYEQISDNKSPDKHSHIIQKIPEEIPSADQFTNEVQSKSSMTKNICLFVANICLVNMFYMILTAYTNGVVRTLERRFGLSSYQTGLLNSCNDIVHIMVVIFVGYFGQKGNKPRIMCVTAMFSAVSGILNASPHFLFPDDPPHLPGDSSNGNLYANHNSKLNDLNSSQNDRTRRNLYDQTNPSAINSKFCQNYPDSFHNFCSQQEPGVHPAYYVFLVSQLINGVGSSAIFTLSMAYIDENSPKNKASIFIGAYTSFYALGPVLGLFLSSVCLKLPENLLSGTSANNTDPSFIGCWWLGYLVGGVGLAFFSLLLWFHPTKDKYGRSSKAEEMKRLTCDEENVQESLHAQLRDLPKAFASLLKNKLYLVNLVVIVAGAYTIYGVFVNLVRYLEVHFFQTASESSIIAGSLLAVTGLVGGFSGGTLISKLRLKTKGGVKLVLCLSFIFSLGLVALINLDCPQVKMDMAVDQSIMAHVVTNDCNKDCKCLTSRKDYYPICGTNGISYFSPCIAGCSHKNNDTFVNCKCISPSPPSSSDLDQSNGDAKMGMTAIAGYCIKQCRLLFPFIGAMFVMSFASTVAKVPSTMVTFRIVKDKERSFALGVNSFVLNLFGFIPGPMVFGKLIDSTCLLWQRTCGTTGACLLFDTKKLRQYTYGASLGVEAITFFGNFCLYLLMRRTPIGMMTLSRPMEHIDMNL